LVQYRFGKDEELAATIASAGQIVPIVVSPFLGFFIDTFGRRTAISKELINLFIY